MAIPLALGLGSLASAQGVPVIDGSNLARAVSRVEELARDALRVNGGVKFGHCGGAKVGQFGASALERAALI